MAFGRPFSISGMKLLTRSPSKSSQSSLIDYLQAPSKPTSGANNLGTSNAQGPPEPQPGDAPKSLSAKCTDCGRDSYHRNTIYSVRYREAFLPFKNSSKCTPCWNLKQRTGQDVSACVKDPKNRAKYKVTLEIYEADYREANPVDGPGGKISRHRNYTTDYTEIVHSDLRRFTQEKDYGVAWPLYILLNSPQKDRLSAHEIEKKKQSIFDSIDNKLVDCIILSSSVPIEPGCIKICVSAEKVTAVNTHGMNSEGAYSTRAVKERWGTMFSATTKLTAIATDVDGVFTISAASPTSSLKRLAERPEEDSASDASVEDDFVDYLSGLVPKAKGKAKSHKQKNLGVAKAKPSASGKRTRDDAEGNTSKKRIVSQKDYLMNRHSDFTKASLALSNARITLNKLQTRQAFFSTAPKDLTKVKDALVKASKPISNLADVDDSIILELDGGSTMLARELKRHISELLEASNHIIARLEDLTHISEACKCGPMKKGEPTLIPSAYEVRGAISLAACKGVQVPLPAVELFLSLDMQDHIDQGSIGSAIKIISGSDTSYLDSMEPTIAMIGQSERMASQELLTSRVIQYCIEKTADDSCFIFAVGVKEHDLFSTSPDMQACMDHFISLNVTAGVVSEEKI